jgi:hypothetical protein
MLTIYGADWFSRRAKFLPTHAGYQLNLDGKAGQIVKYGSGPSVPLLGRS